MKKRFEKVIMDIATSSDPIDDKNLYMKKHIANNKYFVTDGHRIAEFDTDIDDLEKGNVQCEKFMDEVYKKNYVVVDLPTAEEIKAGIRGLCGRKLDRVVFRNDYFAINARWLYKTMEGLSATKCYVNSDNPGKNPVFLFEHDNYDGTNKVAILPCRTIKNEKGLYLA